jgi:hypothetical protein
MPGCTQVQRPCVYETWNVGLSWPFQVSLLGILEFLTFIIIMLKEKKRKVVEKKRKKEIKGEGQNNIVRCIP